VTAYVVLLDANWRNKEELRITLDGDQFTQFEREAIRQWQEKHATREQPRMFGMFFDYT